LSPKDIEPWIGLYNLHKTKGEHQEYLDRTSLNKYNQTVSDMALSYYEKSLYVLEEALQLEPENFDLLLFQVKPLYMIAYYEYLNDRDPLSFYTKALKIINKAHNINLQSARPWMQNAYIYSEMTHYYMTVVKDLNQAENYAIKAVESAQKSNEIDPNYSRVIRVNAYRYSLANVKYEQGEILQASNILRQSVTERFEVIPRRAAFFKNFNDIMRAQHVLIGLLIEIDEPFEKEVAYGKEMINLVCSFDGLIESQHQQIETLIKEYVDNNWLKKDNFTNCQ
jgi:hypothetical protein